MITSPRLLILVSILSGLGAFSAPIASSLLDELLGHKIFNFGPAFIPPTTGGFLPPVETPVHLGPGLVIPSNSILAPPASPTDNSGSIAGPTGFATVNPTVSGSVAPSKDTASSDATPTDVTVPNATRVANPLFGGPGLVIPGGERESGAAPPDGIGIF